MVLIVLDESGGISKLLPVKLVGPAETGTASWGGLASISNTWFCKQSPVMAEGSPSPEFLMPRDSGS